MYDRICIQYVCHVINLTRKNMIDRTGIQIQTLGLSLTASSESNLKQRACARAEHGRETPMLPFVL
jgi:hypothetical protein